MSFSTRNGVALALGVPSTSWMHGSSSPIVSPIREEFLYGRTAEGYSAYPNRTAAELVRD
ncbi:hypothetical protein [Nocardia sp. NPDC004750]